MAVAMVGTPCYVVAAWPVRQAITALDSVPCGLPRRYWLSMKTQPVKPLLDLWRRWGRGVEVVSEYELRAVQAMGFAPEQILVNGVAKHAWLRGCAVPRLNVHFDSLREIDALLPLAKSQSWHVGIRCQPPNQQLPERPGWSDQFGLSHDECVQAMSTISAAGLRVRGIHVHLGTNLVDHREYVRAIEYVEEVAAGAHSGLEYVDLGGGLPALGSVRHDSHSRPALEFEFHDGLADVFRTVMRSLPTVREVWLENGRFVSGRAAALVVRVVDTKERQECRHLICDGGRINHARPAATERHDVMVDPPRGGRAVATVVSGPSSANVDQLGTWNLPAAVDCGDLIIWKDAGAYHLPLETRFSAGLAPVIWVDENGMPTVARRRETADAWWGIWE